MPPSGTGFEHVCARVTFVPLGVIVPLECVVDEPSAFVVTAFSAVPLISNVDAPTVPIFPSVGSCGLYAFAAVRTYVPSAIAPPAAVGPAVFTPLRSTVAPCWASVLHPDEPELPD